jgi:Mrp family chromosome partitioning ATPase
MRRPYWEVWLALVLAATAALAFAVTPPLYVATGGVLLPGGMVRVEYGDRNPQDALAQVERFQQEHRNALFVDRPLVHRTDPWRPWVALALALGLAAMALRTRRRRAVRSERELTAVLGDSLVAARPLAAKQLSRLLLRCWFHRGRTVLPVVSAEGDTGAIALELAKAFAAAGEATLLIDADLRSPSVHRAVKVPNRAGLADFLDGRKPRVAHCADNLSVLVAGRSSEDPLELLSRRRLQDLLAVASRRYSVILVATPAAASGPDMQMFAALAGGALVVTHRAAEASALQRLRGLLEFAKARVVGTVLAPA